MNSKEKTEKRVITNYLTKVRGAGSESITKLLSAY